ncbi:MAG: YkgJ family cysteine cluster protein [Promethearchaeota archaeon]|jgi:Fe-S-cluster containining protein
MVNPNQLRFSCTRCGNCCSDKHTLVNITYLDILRIIQGLKLELSELLEIIGFYVFEGEQSHLFFKKMVFSPIKTEKGLAYVGILKNTQGECFFYEPVKQQCKIYQLRPTLCRTFPFSYDLETQSGIFYTEKAKSYCPGIEGEAPIIDYKHWLIIGKRTIEEIRKNNIFNEQWNKNANGHGNAHSVENYLKKVME